MVLIRFHLPEHNFSHIGPLSGEVLDLELSVRHFFWLGFFLTPSYTYRFLATILCFFLRGVGVVGKRDNDDEDHDIQPSSHSTLKSCDSEEAKTASPSTTTPTF